ncbi:hypothetical protein EG328_007624 [Venturia inaequalis]|uniref:Protein PBN1 n=1 Tax=Venturia inaequalis TaxID=5025 RepID=A0A8H3YSD4_VENIN|nr:hypothetical protein EG328_007624 [Venturia inaequalis]
MKERITYIVRDPKNNEFNPETLEINKNGLSFTKGVDAAREWSVTVGLNELGERIDPRTAQWVYEIMRNSHEFHIRWSTPERYDAIAPFASRVAPGVHAFWTPLADGGDDEEIGTKVCGLLHRLFGPLLPTADKKEIKCESVEKSFTIVPILSGRFSHAASRQFFTYVPDLMNLATYCQILFCPNDDFKCNLPTRQLMTADSFDMDWDSISGAINFKAYWSSARGKEGWKDTHSLQEREKEGSKGSLEVGILMNENTAKGEEEELKFSGVLAQIGKDDRAAPVMFSFPARHHSLPPANNGNRAGPNSGFHAGFIEPTGLHPTLAISVNWRDLVRPSSDCRLHTYLTLPSYLFIDRYPLQDPLFLANHHLKALHSLSGATDLEAPDWVVSQWGSAALFEIDHPEIMEWTKELKQPPFRATIPLHLRYLSPSLSSNTSKPLPPAFNVTDGKAEVLVPWPHVFWVCPASESSAQFPSSPFDRTNLGYDGLFGPKTMFYHFLSNSAVNAKHGAVETLTVPVLNLENWSTKYVEWVTVLFVFGGALLVAGVLGRTLVRDFGTRFKVFGAKSGEAEKKKN